MHKGLLRKNAPERISFSFSDGSRKSRKKMELNWTTQLSFVRGGDDWARGGTWHEGSTCPPRVCRGFSVYCVCVMMPNSRPVCCMTCISSDSFVCRTLRVLVSSHPIERAFISNGLGHRSACLCRVRCSCNVDDLYQ